MSEQNNLHWREYYNDIARQPIKAVYLDFRALYLSGALVPNAFVEPLSSRTA